MIAPTELRLGNYLKLGGVILIVNEINMTGFYAGNEAEGNFKGNVWDIEPIELTEDWLVRMGFKRETKDDKYGRVWQHKDFGNFFLRRVNYNKPFDKADYGFALELSDESNWVTIFKRVQCVHQLQNLFHSLTGEELTVTRNEM